MDEVVVDPPVLVQVQVPGRTLDPILSSTSLPSPRRTDDRLEKSTVRRDVSVLPVFVPVVGRVLGNPRRTAETVRSEDGRHAQGRGWTRPGKGSRRSGLGRAGKSGVSSPLRGSSKKY